MTDADVNKYRTELTWLKIQINSSYGHSSMGSVNILDYYKRYQEIYDILRNDKFIKLRNEKILKLKEKINGN